MVNIPLANFAEVIRIKIVRITWTLRLEKCLRLGLRAKISAISISYWWAAISNRDLPPTSNDSEGSQQYDAQPEPQKSIAPSGPTPKQSSLCHGDNPRPEASPAP